MPDKTSIGGHLSNKTTTGRETQVSAKKYAANRTSMIKQCSRCRKVFEYVPHIHLLGIEVDCVYFGGFDLGESSCMGDMLGGRLEVLEVVSIPERSL